MKGMIKQVVEAQKESDKKFVELEKKRIKWKRHNRKGRNRCTATIKNFRCVCIK